MKRILVTIISLCAFSFISNAQDAITTKDGTDILAKVIEINQNDIKYKRWNNLDGPTYTMSISDILMIRYENGTKEKFNTNTNNNNSSKSAKDKTPVNVANATNATNVTNVVPESQVLFISNVQKLKEGLRYSDLEDYYDTSDYSKLADPLYSTSRLFLNFAVPGLAQYTMGEPGLGTKFLLLCTLVPLGSVAGGAGLSTIGEAGNIAGIIIASAGLGTGIGFWIVSLINAANVAKVKSLYASDIMTVKNNFSFEFSPSVLPVVGPNSLAMAPGLTMRISF